MEQGAVKVDYARQDRTSGSGSVVISWLHSYTAVLPARLSATLLPRGILPTPGGLPIRLRKAANYARFLYDFLTLRPSLLRCVDAPNPQILNRGCLVISAHLGHWELLAAWLATRRPTDGIASSTGGQRLGELRERLRLRVGIRTLYAEDPSLGWAIRKTLRSDRHLMVLLDRDWPGGEPVTIAGEPRRMPSRLLRLAHQRGVPIVPAFCLMTTHRRYRILVEPPLSLPTPNKVAETLTRAIHPHRDQWFEFPKKSSHNFHGKW